MNNIIIDPEFKALIPPLAPEELAQLEANIIKDGCRDPLVVWPLPEYIEDGVVLAKYEDREHICENDEGYVYGWHLNLPEDSDDDETIFEGEWPCILIDGHNRYDICNRNDIEFQTVEMEFESKAHARIWMRDNQKGRRNLNDAWVIELELGNKADLIEIGRAKSAATVGRPTKESLSQNDNNLPEPKHNTQKEIAKAAGVSTGQVGMAEQVKKKDPALWEQAKSGEVSISSAYKTIKKKEQIDLRHHDYTEKTKNETKAIPPTISLCDCIEWLELQEESDLLITDPPYSTDVQDINAFAAEWLPLALSKVKSTGRAYVCVGAYPDELAAYFKVAMPTQVLVWTYRNTLGPSPSHSYKLNWQAILYYQMPDAAPLNCPVMLEQFSVQDINAPDGRLGDRYHAWQKPMQLAERLIRHSTNEGASVIDPFACTGTFLLAASSLGRVAKGCEINAENLTIAINRGCIHEQ